MSRAGFQALFDAGVTVIDEAVRFLRAPRQPLSTRLSAAEQNPERASSPL
jgi:hypothetical protein